MRKRTLIYFMPILGIVNDDYMREIKTMRIFYKLKGQKRQRFWDIKLSIHFIKDVTMCKMFIWGNFKKAFNIIK